MTYDTINDGEATPLQISEGTTAAAPNSRKKRASPIIVRAMMVGTAVGTRDLVGGGDIEEYGSTQQEEEFRGVPLAMLDRHHHPTTNQHPNTTRTPASTWKTKTVVRTLLVGTAVGTLLLMVGPSKMAPRNSSRNVDGTIVVSSATSHLSDADSCLVPPSAVEAVSGMVILSSATSHLSDSSVASEALILNKNDDPGGNI